MSRSRAHSPIQAVFPARQSRSRSRSYSPPHVIRVTASRASGGSSPRYPRPHDSRRHSRSHSPSGARLHYAQIDQHPEPRRAHERTITLNINININREGEIRVGSPRTPRSTTQGYNIRHTVDLPRQTREVESPIQIQIPFASNDSRSNYRPATPVVVQPSVQATTDSPYSSAVLRGSTAVPGRVSGNVRIDSLVESPEVDEITFPHQEYYTHIRCPVVDGRKVVQKSIRRSIVRRNGNSGSFYLNYGEDMLRLKHDHLVEILDVFRQTSMGVSVLSMEHYSTDLLTYRENLDRANQLRVFCEILEGLNALHTSEPPIAHQCLKASNIMIDATGSAKLSLMNSEPYLAFSMRPTPSLSYSSDWPIISRWWSPEIYQLRTTISRPENDIWAFGCVMLEVLTGATPYPNFQADPALVQHILAGNTPDSGVRRPSRLKLWQDVRRCWTTPRPTASSLLDSMCDQLSREILKEVPDLTGKVARTRNPFIRGHSADIYTGIYNDRTVEIIQKSVVVKHVMPNYTTHKSKFILWLGACAQNRTRFIHLNICPLLGVMYTGKLGPLLVYDHHSGGNLFDYLRVKGPSLLFQNKLQVMSGILDALVHLHHEQDIAWGDLHPGNIMLDDTGNPKLCGLGPRPSLQHEAASKSDLSAIRYFGPERYRAEDTLPDKAGDVWAFGCLIVKILNGGDPYQEARTAYGVIRAVTSGQRPYEKSDCENLPLWNMASSCWTEGVLERPMATSLARRIETLQT
ncbi:kinase-like protein [Ceratobasidium sp. AG-Ba]|nr:kinase-like protein [Ceratobasidium sp. AG-Ba]